MPLKTKRAVRATLLFAIAGLIVNVIALALMVARHRNLDIVFLLILVAGWVWLVVVLKNKLKTVNG